MNCFMSPFPGGSARLSGRDQAPLRARGRSIPSPAVEGGVGSLAAGGTAVALLGTGVGPDVAQAGFPPVQAVEVRAELTGRVHRVFLRGSSCVPRGYAMDLFA